MTLKLTSQLNDNLLQQAAHLHYETLSYRSFITSFGRRFLYELYKGMLTHGLAVFVFATGDSELKGFVLGCTDSTRLVSLVLKRFWVFAPLIIPVLLRSPGSVTKLIETVLYSKKVGAETKAELLVIAVKARYRSKRIGFLLLQKLDDEFTKRGILEYKVTVHKEMTRSNDFYVKNGMTLSKTFTLYNVPWNLYVKRIADRDTDGACGDDRQHTLGKTNFPG